MTLLTAADLLNDRVIPFFEEHEFLLQRVLALPPMPPRGACRAHARGPVCDPAAIPSAKARRISNPMTRTPAPPFLFVQRREVAGDTKSTDPRSRRIRESRNGRPCNELGLSAHCLSAACPHLRAPGALCPGWAHHIASFPFGNSRTTRRRRISYRIMGKSKE